jgi:hypothetical protein
MCIDDISNRIHYEFWKDFIIFLCEDKGISYDNLPLKKNVEQARLIIYNISQSCAYLPTLFIPVVKEIISEEYPPFEMV